jgi:hypothetical protein
MAQVKLLKISASGRRAEMDSAADDITLNSYTASTSFSVTGGVTIDSNITFNALTDTIAGIQNQNLLDKTASETISGDYTYTGVNDITAGDLRIPTAISGAPATGDVYLNAGTQQVFAYDGSTYFDIGGTGSASSVEITYTAGTGGITIGDAVYISGADTVLPANADIEGTSSVIGFAKTTEAATNPVVVVTKGIVPGVLTGATPGAVYYLDITNGQITTTVPTGSADVVLEVGYAKNATDLHVEIKGLDIRAA